MVVDSALGIVKSSPVCILMYRRGEYSAHLTNVEIINLAKVAENRSDREYATIDAHPVGQRRS